jgi:hypothetical protein
MEMAVVLYVNPALCYFYQMLLPDVSIPLATIATTVLYRDSYAVIRSVVMV